MWFLESKSIDTTNGLFYHNRTILRKCFGGFNMLERNGVSTPFDPSVNLCKNKETSVSQLDCSRTIGCLMCIINCTWPDIAHAVSKLSGYTTNPNYEHWTVVIRLFKYLKKPLIMTCNMRNISWYKKGTAMLAGYWILRDLSPQGAMYLHVLIQLSHGKKEKKL